MDTANGRSKAMQMAVTRRPKVSVIIPTYNRARLLKDALDSLNAQTFSDFETIVVDDGSTDDTPQLIESHSLKIRYVHLEHIGLPSVVRNAGLRIAQGAYWAFLDSDDQWLPQKLERQVAIMDTRPRVGIVCSNAFVLGEHEQTASRLYLQERQGKSGWVLNELLRDNFLITSTVLTRALLLDRTGVFSEDPLLRAVEDYDLWLRISAIAEICYLPDALVIYRDHRGSTRSQQSPIFYWEGMLYVVKRLRKFLKNSVSASPVSPHLLNDLAFTYQNALCHAYLQTLNWWFRLFVRRRQEALWFVCRKILGWILYRLPKTGSLVFGLRSGDRPARLDKSAENKEKALKLHLGCGEVYLPGYVNVDFARDHHTVQQNTKVDVHADITELSYPVGSVDEIRLHHVFEHFDRVTGIALLMEWYGWLRVGGKLVIETPDFEKSVKVFLRKRRIEHQLRCLRHIFGSHEAPWASHNDGWYRRKFELYLSSLGYGDLTFNRSKWKGIYNVTVTARKILPLKTREELSQSGEDLLRMSLVDGSETERRILEVWRNRLRSQMGKLERS